MAETFGDKFADAVVRGTNIAKNAWRAFVDYLIVQAARAAGSWAFRLLMFTLSGGNPLAAIGGLFVGGFPQGGSGASRMFPGSEDSVPALIKPSERVVPAGHPDSAGAGGGGGITAVAYTQLTLATSASA